MMDSCIYSATLTHSRFKPKAHRFQYRVCSWLVDLDELDILNQQFFLFSRNKLNFFSFYDTDYGDGSELSLKQQITKLLAANNSEQPEKVRLLCFPRVLGYVFNPLSIYFCYRKDGSLLAVLHEVTNTFGERHTYVIPCDKCYAEDDIIRQYADKKMHVSPFMSMDYQYSFSLQPPGLALFVAINMLDAEGISFSASLAGKRLAITQSRMFKQLLQMPLMSLKVMSAILWQAACLYCKGLKVYQHQPRANAVDSSLGACSSVSPSTRVIES